MSREQTWIITLVAAALGLLAQASAASASGWTVRQLGDEAARSTLFGVSCPTTSLCVAVGSDNTIASSTDPTGSAASWTAVYAGAGAVEQGGPNQREVRGVSCPSPQLCVAVSFEGIIYTSTNPTGSAREWAVTDLNGEGPNIHMYGISCPSPSFCVAAAGNGAILTSTDPTGGAAAWSDTQLEEPLELRGISCPSPALCVLVGDRGGIRPETSDRGVILSSTAPLLGTWPQVEPSGTQGDLFGLSCPGSALCISGDANGQLLISANPNGSPSSWAATAGGGSVQITGISCASTSRCLAVDSNGDVIASSEPGPDPAAWTLTNVAPFPGLDETRRPLPFDHALRGGRQGWSDLHQRRSVLRTEGITARRAKTALPPAPQGAEATARDHRSRP